MRVDANKLLQWCSGLYPGCCCCCFCTASAAQAKKEKQGHAVSSVVEKNVLGVLNYYSVALHKSDNTVVARSPVRSTSQLSHCIFQSFDSLLHANRIGLL
jgi:hypothetical protein